MGGRVVACRGLWPAHGALLMVAALTTRENTREHVRTRENPETQPAFLAHDRVMTMIGL